MEDYNKEELEQLLLMAYYQEEIEKRKLAAQLVLTLGEACSDEKIMRILTEDCQRVTICPEQLIHENIECDGFYVMKRGEKLLVVITDLEGKKAEVYADYGSPDGVLLIGKEAYQTMDGTVYELEETEAEELQLIVYTYPVEYEAERITERE